MAHSYIFATNTSNTERSVAIPDEAIHLFMYFFNEIALLEVKPDSKQSEICESYKKDVIQYPWSCFEARLQEVSANSELKTWYEVILSRLSLQFDAFGGYVDHHYLNQIPLLSEAHNGNANAYSQPISVSVFHDLINDICWVLNKEGYKPSGSYKFFEENI